MNFKIVQRALFFFMPFLMMDSMSAFCSFYLRNFINESSHTIKCIHINRNTKNAYFSAEKLEPQSVRKFNKHIFSDINVTGFKEQLPISFLAEVDSRVTHIMWNFLLHIFSKINFSKDLECNLKKINQCIQVELALEKKTNHPYREENSYQTIYNYCLDLPCSEEIIFYCDVIYDGLTVKVNIEQTTQPVIEFCIISTMNNVSTALVSQHDMLTDDESDWVCV